MIKNFFSYKSEEKYTIIYIFGIKITLKKNKYEKFIKHKIKKKILS